MAEVEADPKILSPVTGKDPCRLLARMKSSQIVQKVWNQYHIDASEYFRGIEEVFLMECTATGYRFFYPYQIAADERFYQLLASKEYYYPARRWEFHKAMEHIGEEDQVLEVGAGEGDFLMMLRERGIWGLGLEFSRAAVEAMEQKKLKASALPVQDFSRMQPAAFDVVCFFQVLEHVSEVRSFMQAAVDCLRPGGRLLLAVPNNDSPVLKYDQASGDNIPPHHMGLWTRSSLEKMAPCFGLRLIRTENQPLPEHYRGLYYKLLLRRNLGGTLGDLVAGTTRWAAKMYLRSKLEQIPGPAIFAAYEKTLK